MFGVRPIIPEEMFVPGCLTIEAAIDAAWFGGPDGTGPIAPERL